MKAVNLTLLQDFIDIEIFLIRKFNFTMESLNNMALFELDVYFNNCLNLYKKENAPSDEET